LAAETLSCFGRATRLISMDTLSHATQMRQMLRQIFLQTLDEIAIPKVFSRKIEYSRGVLRVEQDLYDLASYSPVLVIAMGKAAHTMLASLIEQTGPVLEGIVVCSHLPESQQPGFRYFSGGHPLPTGESVRAARAIFKSVADLNEHALIIYLISGGASAMAELPRDEDISLDDIVETYRILVHSSAAIGEINAIRKHLSAIKGGRLAQAASPARQVSIMVSDVPEQSLDALASGPTMPDSTTTADCYRIAEKHNLTVQFRENVRRLFAQRALEETPKADDPAFVNARWWPILSSNSSVQAAAALLSQHGFAVEIDNTPDDWPCDRAAEYVLARLRELRKGVSRVALVSAGEITLQVNALAGVGGRNQHFVLSCAERIAGENIAVLSAGTDGIDGNSPAAGAIADGSTASRTKEIGLKPAAALREFDSFPILERLGDSIVTGPTGNNVRDLRVLLAW
jgi:glycerate 2-kinase